MVRKEKSTLFSMTFQVPFFAFSMTISVQFPRLFIEQVRLS